MKNIALSPTHGLNPAMVKCFFCGEPKHELAILGMLKNDAEAPRDGVIIDYEPCMACKAKFKKGILMLGVTETQPKDRRPAIVKEPKTLYPTGSYVVATPDFIKRSAGDMAGEIIKNRRCLIDQAELEHLQAEHEKAIEE